jgi:hypothetical protein
MINNSYGDINYLLYSSGVTFEARLPVDNPGAMATIQGINAVSGILFDPADLDLLRQEVAKWAPAAARAQQEFLTNPGFVKKLMEELPSVIPEDSQTGEERVIFQMLINLAGESNKPVPLAIQGPYNFTQGEPTPPAPVNAGPVVGPSA